MSAVGTIARRRQRALAQLIALTVADVEAIWAEMSAALDVSWATVGPRIVQRVTVAQQLAASSADPYLASLQSAYGISGQATGRVLPSALSGLASSGDPLSWLLRSPLVRTKLARQAGMSTVQALRAGQANLVMHTATQVADAARAADLVAVVNRPWVSYSVRQISAGACSRCMILGGRRYKWDTQFRRHPGCGCVNIPGPEDMPDDLRTDPKAAFDKLSGSEQDRRFGKAGAQAIRDGADMGQIVNARRGMTTATVGGRDLLTTTAGTSRSGSYSHQRRAIDQLLGRRSVQRPRLMPEQIVKQANGSRAEARRLLIGNGYMAGDFAALAQEYIRLGA